MKAIVALATLTLALSLCNLLGKRGNTNENANSRSSGTSSETSASPSPALNESETSSAPRQDLGSAAPPSQRGPRAPDSSRADIPPPPPAPATPHPSPKTISGGVLNGKAISLPQPTYPPIAKAAHASGQVSVLVIIDENGNVISATGMSGHPLLRQSAANAARQAKFSPTKLSGQPVKVSGVLIYNFVAQ